MMILRPNKYSVSQCQCHISLSHSSLLTGYDGDCLESPEYSEGSERCQITKDRGEVAGDDHQEVQAVPRTSEVSVRLQDESHGQDFDYHLCCVDDQECKSTTRCSCLHPGTHYVTLMRSLRIR